MKEDNFSKGFIIGFISGVFITTISAIMSIVF